MLPPNCVESVTFEELCSGRLALIGNYSQTRGKVEFQIDANGSGGFDISKLLLNAGDTISLADTRIVFDFVSKSEASSRAGVSTSTTSFWRATAACSPMTST